MNKFKKIAMLVGILTIVAMCIYFCISYHMTKTELASVKQELNIVQNSLSAESDKLTNTQDELNRANEVIASREGDVYFIDCEVTEYEINMIAKTVWGEAGGCSALEQSAVVWCILNRVDEGRGSIAQVITAPNQFHGYSSNFPVTDEIKALVKDVVARWKIEKLCYGDVGRTLPGNYTYFVADGTGAGNIFNTSWRGDGERWDWNCWNPYK